MITRIGLDDWGKKLVKLMEENNISTDSFQLDDILETGKVNATINQNNEVIYEILKPVAWDNIQWEDKLETLVCDADYFVFVSTAKEVKQEVSQKWSDVRGHDDVSYPGTLCSLFV
jgi:fructokinase